MIYSCCHFIIGNFYIKLFCNKDEDMIFTDYQMYTISIELFQSWLLNVLANVWGLPIPVYCSPGLRAYMWTITMDYLPIRSRSSPSQLLDVFKFEHGFTLLTWLFLPELSSAAILPTRLRCLDAWGGNFTLWRNISDKLCDILFYKRHVYQSDVGYYYQYCGSSYMSVFWLQDRIVDCNWIPTGLSQDKCDCMPWWSPESLFMSHCLLEFALVNMSISNMWSQYFDIVGDYPGFTLNFNLLLFGCETGTGDLRIQYRARLENSYLQLADNFCRCITVKLYALEKHKLNYLYPSPRLRSFYSITCSVLLWNLF